MAYTYDRVLKDVAVDDAEMLVRDALAEKGFGVLTEIDVKATMHEKLGVEMPPYRILGACNPGMAHKAIEIEPRIGAMLPCNVILRQVNGGTEISAIDPVASMQAVENAELHSVAGQVRDLLRAALDAA
ncbi:MULTISPECIES: DUF302 domain-containing protein [Roseobacteraceae]|mgnify:CR=1 FL=1|jgi:uncharacterized protein (DUF302 family)|uniref:Uncharacterized conserved protein, DUF302 family n=1 Tax=Thalassovita taeanensis TaxID=657014 RepID=A0A1H9GNP1_9RHOB|nr:MULTISPECIES: DUF302 domain-containing protein [Roseobacteraceae]EAQ23370.1 hypothetical protein ROS217_03340 [Roseovarius sp. 217]SEQ51696.1 Uncharacterized conserved protein, DUF302 family [Thalassovita taeanensis]